MGFRALFVPRNPDAKEKILTRLGDLSLRCASVLRSKATVKDESPKQQGQCRSGAEPTDNTEPLTRKDIEPLELARAALPSDWPEWMRKFKDY